MEGSIKVLYVDDELNNLNSFQAAFRLEYQIFTAASADEALGVLESNPDIQIIFCDQRMPGKTGVEFFQDIRTSFPYAVRILVTGYSDMEAIVAAINRGNILRYVSKPWSREEIRAIVEEGYRFYLTNSIMAKKHKELQEAYLRLDEFSMELANSVREPLLSVLGIVDIARTMPQMPEEFSEIISIVSGTMLQLDQYLTEVQSRYERRGKLIFTDISFDHVLPAIAAPYSRLARARGIRFYYEASQHEFFYSDENVVRMLLNEMLACSFRHTDTGKVDEISLHIRVEGGGAYIGLRRKSYGDQPENLREFIARMGLELPKTSVFGEKGTELAEGLSLLRAQLLEESISGAGYSIQLYLPSNEVVIAAATEQAEG